MISLFFHYRFQLVDFGLAHLESEKQSHKEQKGTKNDIIASLLPPPPPHNLCKYMYAMCIFTPALSPIVLLAVLFISQVSRRADLRNAAPLVCFTLPHRLSPSPPISLNPRKQPTLLLTTPQPLPLPRVPPAPLLLIIICVPLGSMELWLRP